jgi:hypothetical protein
MHHQEPILLLRGLVRDVDVMGKNRVEPIFNRADEVRCSDKVPTGIAVGAIPDLAVAGQLLVCSVEVGGKTS